MSDMQPMIFIQKLIKKYSGHKLKEQMIARKTRNGMLKDNENKFAGVLPQEQLRAMGHNASDILTSRLEYNSPIKEDNYIKKQYNKRSNLLEEVDIDSIGTNSK